MWMRQHMVMQIADGSYQQGPISLDQPVGSLPIVDDARWSAALTSHSLWALVVWIALLVILQAAAWPLVRRLFPRFPDQGWAFARLTTLLLAGLLVWYAASLEVIAFRAMWCAVATLIVAGLSWGLQRSVRPHASEGTSQPWFRNRYIVATEIVFWAAFALFLLFRLINPDSYHPAWGGEKPMEFAHINAILRSAHFPPYDPWYADGVLNYYYYGMYLVAFMMKLTGIPSEIAFNLAQPTIIAFLAVGVFSVSMAIARSVSRRPVVVWTGGLIGIVLVNIAGNLVVAARAIAALSEDAPPLSDFGYWYWNPREIVAFTINEFPWFTATYADLHAHVVALPITVLIVALAFSLVQSPRAIVLSLGRHRRYHVTDVLRVLGIGVLVSVSLGTLYMTNAWDVPTYAALVAVSVLLATRGIRSTLMRMAVSMAFVALVTIFAWLAALPFLRDYVALYGEIEATRMGTAPVQVVSHLGVFLVIIAFGLSMIISRDWETPGPTWMAPAFGLGLLSLLIIRWYGVGQSMEWIDGADTLLVGGIGLWFVYSLVRPSTRPIDFRLSNQQQILYGLAFEAAVVWSLVADRIALGLFLAIGLPAVVVCFGRRSAAERFIGLLVAGAMLVGAAMEIVFLVDGLAGSDWYRMNSVFKFYNQVWVMAALASAGFIALMVREVAVTPLSSAPFALQSPTLSAEPLDSVVDTGLADDGVAVDDPFVPASSFSWGQIGLIAAALLIAASLAYPILSTGVRLQQRYPADGMHLTLNATDWMTYGAQRDYGSLGVTFTYDGDREIINWFNSDVPGTPVIAEASLNGYACGTGRVSNHTGLPVVIGWPWHEQQQRGSTDIGERQANLRLMYTSLDPVEKLELLDRYAVEYVVVGDLERWYPSADCQATDNTAGIAVFDEMVANGNLEIAFQSGDAVVYRVLQN